MKVPKDYMQLMDQVKAHWVFVNSGQPQPLALAGGYTLSNLNADCDSFRGFGAQMAEAENGLTAAMARRDKLREDALERMRQFNRIVRCFFMDTPYPAMLPALPHPQASAGKWMEAMRAVLNIWPQIDAINPKPLGAPIPLMLQGNFARPAFAMLQSNLISSFTDVDNAQNALKQVRDRREKLWSSVWSRLVQFRLVVQASFAANDPKVLTLPRITPKKGHTPKPVEVRARWDEALGKAVIEFEASAEKTVERYALQACLGPKFLAKQSAIIASLPVGEPLRFETEFGLMEPGAVVSFRVVVVLSTGNEKGSEVMTVTRG